MATQGDVVLVCNLCYVWLSCLVWTVMAMCYPIWARWATALRRHPAGQLLRLQMQLRQRLAGTAAANPTAVADCPVCSGQRCEIAAGRCVAGLTPSLHARGPIRVPTRREQHIARHRLAHRARRWAGPKVCAAGCQPAAEPAAKVAAFCCCCLGCRGLGPVSLFLRA